MPELARETVRIKPAYAYFGSLVRFPCAFLSAHHGVPLRDSHLGSCRIVIADGHLVRGGFVNLVLFGAVVAPARVRASRNIHHVEYGAVHRIRKICGSGVNEFGRAGR